MKGGMNTKRHAVADADGRPLSVFETANLPKGARKRFGRFPAALDEGPVGVTHRAESLDAMMCTHAIRPCTTKGLVVLRDINHRVVDNDIVEGGQPQQAPALGILLPEVIERERPW
ncbi:hypothetical protein BSY16_6038 (plasmid) [Sinorhizobium sp. RAC02]|nr:hypothetical protein BSY16_6038 [Sinorhizobium sp. RAC02]